MVAGLGDAVDGLGMVLVAAHGLNVATFTFVGEVVLIVWLLVGGRRIAVIERDAGSAVVTARPASSAARPDVPG